MSKVYFLKGFFLPYHQFPFPSFPKYSTFSAISGSFLANLHLIPPLFSVIEMFTSTAVEVPLPPRKFSKLALCASSLLHCRKLLTKIHRTTSLLLYRLLKPHGLIKPSSTVELLLPCDYFMATAAIRVLLFPWNWGCLPRARGYDWALNSCKAGYRRPESRTMHAQVQQ